MSNFDHLTHGGIAINEGLGYGTPNRYEIDQQTMETWDRPYNPTVVNVLASQYANEDTYLFGAVGDLDNLGHHVAHQGRPAAENLVDLYNQAIRNVVATWGHAHNDRLAGLTFVPSGEEVLILGSTADPEGAKEFLGGLRDLVMERMHSQSILDIGETAASFGPVMFGHRYDTDIEEFIMAIGFGEDREAAARQYFDLLGKMRNEMAVSLDQQKFGGLMPTIEGVGVPLRRLAWTGMMGYKEDTRNLIHRLATMHTDNPESVGAVLTELGSWNPGVPKDCRFRVAQMMADLGIVDVAPRIEDTADGS